MKFSLHLIITFGLFSLAAGFNKRAQHFNSYQSDTFLYTIIKFDKAYYWVSKSAKPTTLTAKEVELAESLLGKAAEEYNKTMEKPAYHIKPLTEYKRQFVPFINSKREKEIWINCLCGQQGDRWRKEIIMVDDGGNCYFNLKVNLTTKTYYALAVNGYA